MNSFSENERQIRSLADTLPKDLQLTASVWLILRRAPKEHQGKLLHLYETLFRTGAQPTQLLRLDNPGQPPFALLLANSFLDLSFHLNFPPDTFYREVCQWLMRQSSFSEQAQLLHYIVTDARLPYFQFDPKLRQGMSSQHFNLLMEDIPAETKPTSAGWFTEIFPTAIGDTGSFSQSLTANPIPTSEPLFWHSSQTNPSDARISKSTSIYYRNGKSVSVTKHPILPARSLQKHKTQTIKEELHMSKHTCSRCHGSGLIPCPRCGGTRRLSGELCYYCDERTDGMKECPVCYGSGTVSDR